MSEWQEARVSRRAEVLRELDKRLVQHIRRELDPKGTMEDSDDVLFYDLARAWDAWQFVKATDWAHLADLGGFFDQEATLMADIMTIQWRYSVVKAHMETNKAQKDAGET